MCWNFILQALFLSAQHLYEKREGSRSGARAGSIPLTNRSGSGSKRPQNMRIRLRIPNTGQNADFLLYISEETYPRVLQGFMTYHPLIFLRTKCRRVCGDPVVQLWRAERARVSGLQRPFALHLGREGRKEGGQVPLLPLPLSLHLGTRGTIRFWHRFLKWCVYLRYM
jgi:hypothetical protein